MLFGLFYSPASAYSSFSMPILSFMPILPLILHLMPIPTLPPPTPPPQFPTSPALSNPIPELILALLGSAMRPGSSWRRLVRLHSTFETICLRHSQSVTPFSLM